MLLDLDNTLVDRAAAFNSWASDFVLNLGRPESDVEWLIKADRDGYEPRSSLAYAIKKEFTLNTPVENLVNQLLYEHVNSMAIDIATTTALKNAKEHGWKIAIVTNGTTAQQSLKIQKVGLDLYVDTVVISEAEGVKKPDSRIFRIAAQRLGQISAAWMIGDHPTTDIAGAQTIGLKTVWVSRGAQWVEDSFSPTLVSATAADAINEVVFGTGPHVDNLGL